MGRRKGQPLTIAPYRRAHMGAAILAGAGIVLLLGFISFMLGTL